MDRKLFGLADKILIIFVMLGSIGMFGVILMFMNNQYKKEIEKIKYKDQKIVDKLEKEKSDIMNTAFYLKDFLSNDYYVTDAKKFERFVLISSRYILLEQKKWKIKGKNRMTKEELKNFLKITYKGGKLYGIDPYLLIAIDGVESCGFNKLAKSKVGALGICQFMPFTAELVSSTYTPYEELRLDKFLVKKLYDPIYSKKLQILFLHHLFENFDGRVQWVLISYNIGPQYVLKYYWNNGNTKFNDLKDDDRKLKIGKVYVERVIGVYSKIKRGDF